MSWIVILIIAAVGIAAAVADARKTGRSAYSGDHSIGSGGSRKTGTLIEHPHYCADSDYECSECGERFEDEASSCPYCGAVFMDTETDRREYDDEEDEEDWWDEEEEEGR